MSSGTETSTKRSSIIALIVLHALLLFYSFAGVLSKSAARESFLSLRFCLFYGGLIFILGVYAIVWQQVIKKLPLTFAYANKAIGIIWVMIWGKVFFGEIISIQKIIGAIVVIIGILMYTLWGAYEQK